MKYAVLIYQQEIEPQKLDNENVQVYKSTIPSYFKGQQVFPYKIKVQEFMTIADILRMWKVSEDQIEEFIDYTINQFMPNATSESKEEARKNYLNAKKLLEFEGFVVPYESSKSEGDPNIIMARSGVLHDLLRSLGIKENLTINFLTSQNVLLDDFLLWIYWSRVNSRKFPNLEINRIVKDSTRDMKYDARGQIEKGGDNVLDSLDLKFRVGKGYPLTGLSFVAIETYFGAKVEIGISIEDKNGPFITVSDFYPYKSKHDERVGSLRDQLDSASDPNTAGEIYKNTLAVDIIWRLMEEYKKDYNIWQSEKPKFIEAQAKEAEEEAKKASNGATIS